MFEEDQREGEAGEQGCSTAGFQLTLREHILFKLFKQKHKGQKGCGVHFRELKNF